MAEPSNPHDALFKAAFGTREGALSQVRALLPSELLGALDLSSLAPAHTGFIDDDLRERQSDLLFSVRAHAREALLYVLYEHQSTPDPLMPFRLLRYMVRIWDWWLEGQRTEKRSPQRLPAILPLLLYNGEQRWSVARRFQELLDLPPEALRSVRRFLPELELLLDDLSERADQDLLARQAPAAASLTLLLFKHARRPGEALEVWEAHPELILQLTREEGWSFMLRLLARYTYVVSDVPWEALVRVVREAAGPEAEEAVMTTAEKLKEEGQREGQKQGRREMLLRLLRGRFGEQLPAGVVNRVAQGEIEALDSWADRVLTATTLEEVFVSES